MNKVWELLDWLSNEHDDCAFEIRFDVTFVLIYIVRDGLHAADTLTRREFDGHTISMLRRRITQSVERIREV